MVRIRPISYQVLLTPLVAKNTYGTEIDITKDVEIDDYIKQKSINSISREIDNGDFDIGVYVFNSVDITCLNSTGMFSDPMDSRSIFKYSRDKAKIVINFFDGLSNTSKISFKGMIDDRASKADFNKKEVKFKILSRDAIFNKSKVSGGTIATSSLCSVAINSILNQADIMAVLNYDPAKIVVQKDFVIDDPTKLEGQSVKDALDKLLSACNSVLTIDSTDTIIVADRTHISGTIFNLYGPGDLFNRENIIELSEYNTGLQRAFTAFESDGLEVSDMGMIDCCGSNIKSVDLDFVTNTTTKTEILQNLLDNWKIPKIELEVKCRTKEVKDLDFFDLVSIDYPYQYKPYAGNRLPLYGSAIYGSAVYPQTIGMMKISPKIAFKIVGIREDPKDFTTTLKLRQTGISIDDGNFATLGTYYGSAAYGRSVYQYDPNLIDPNRISVYGAGRYGTIIYRE